MKLGWIAAAAALLLAGCSGDGGNTADAASGDDTAAVKTAAQAYSDAYLAGDADTAYQLLSARCQDRTTATEMAALVKAAADTYGDPLPFDTFNADINDDQARVTYTYNGHPEINQQQEPWVRENGEWREDDC